VAVFLKHHPEAGSRPGTLAIPPDSPRPKVVVTQFDETGVERIEAPALEELPAMLHSGKTMWVDVQGLGDEGTLRAIGDTFGLHPLSLEDAVNVPQRAKAVLREGYQLVIARAPRVDAAGALGVPQVCFVVGEHHLLTFQERYLAFFDRVRERIDQGLGPIRRGGPGYLAYALIDAMVDSYYPVAQELSDRLEALEDIVVERPHPEVLARVHSLRRQVSVLRRVGRPQQEALRSLVRTETPFVGEREHVYLRDTLDHMSQIVELLDSSRDLAASLAEAYLSNLSHRTNEIMKMLTLMASIFIPLTFIAGIYGMNFEHMPELHAPRGYFVVLALMGATAGGMVAYFRYRGWIGSPPRPSGLD